MADVSNVRKLCFRCGVDVAGKPRTKDSRGHYYCASCDAAMRAQYAHGAAVAGAGDPGDEPADLLSPVGSAGGPHDQGGDDGIIPLADDTLPADELAALAAAERGADGIATSNVEFVRDGRRGANGDAGNVQGRHPKSCAACGRVMAKSSVICVSCGHNRETGRNVGTGKLAGAGKTCSKCGYHMTGAPSVRCPECGTVNTKKGRRDHDREYSKQVARATYTKPLVQVAIALPIAFLLAWQQGGLAAGVVYLFQFGVSLPVGTIAFFLVCLMLTGFDEPLHVAGLKLAGIFAIADVVSMVFHYIPLPWIHWAVPLAVHIGMLMEEFELELMEAFGLAFMTWIFKMGAFVGMYFLAVELGWI